MIDLVQDKSGRFLINVEDCGIPLLKLAMTDLPVVTFDEEPDTTMYVYIVDLRAHWAHVQDEKWVDLLTEMLDRLEGQSA